MASPEVPIPGKSPGDDKEKKRLVALTTREVSLVDNMANEKPFIAIKNLSEKGGIEMKREKVVDGEGKEVQVVKDEKTDDSVTPELTEEEAQIALAKDLDITVDELKVLQESAKDDGGDGAGGGVGDAGAGDAGSDADGKEKQAKLPADTEALIKKLIALLTKLLQKYPYGAPQKAAQKDEGGDGTGTAAGEAGKVEGEAGDTQGVEKVGSPISRERLKTLKGVVQTLQKLLDELDKKSKGGEGEETPAKKADEKGKGEPKKEESPVKKDESGDGAGGGDGKEEPNLLEVVAELKGRVEAMQQMVGTQKGQEAEGTEGGEQNQGLWSGVL